MQPRGALRDPAAGSFQELALNVIGALIEVPAVAVALDLDDADLLELLQARMPAAGWRTTGSSWRRAGSDPSGGYVTSAPLRAAIQPAAAVVVEPSMNSGRSAPLPKSSPTPRITSTLTSSSTVARVQQVGVANLRRDGRRVEVVGPVERDRRDLGRGILLVEDDLLGSRTVLIGHVRPISPTIGLDVRTSAPSSVMRTASRRNTAPTPFSHT